MLTQDEILEHPNYLLTTYQLEIYRQLEEYMKKNNLRRKDVAKKLQVSRSYISQVLSGEFNFTLKKLIELGLMMNKVPYLEFVTPEEYWRREKEGTVKYYTVSTPEKLKSNNCDPFPEYNFDMHGGKLPESSVNFV